MVVEALVRSVVDLRRLLRGMKRARENKLLQVIPNYVIELHANVMPLEESMTVCVTLVKSSKLRLFLQQWSVPLKQLLLKLKSS